MPQTAQSVQHGTTAPGIAAGAAAGTAPTVAMAAGATDSVGVANITTGTATPAGGILATITFNRAFKTAPKVIILSHVLNTAAAATVDLRVGTVTTTTFTIETTSTATASKAYAVAYLVVPEDGEV